MLRGNYNLATFILIDKMNLGEGALKVEGPIAQKGSITLEVTVATKKMPTTLKTPLTPVLGRQRDSENGCHRTSETPTLPIPSPSMKV